jgi:hypothetical protein
MIWPSLDRYNSALHQPETCFSDRDLRGAWPVRDRRGLPVPATGAFGCVYHLTALGRAWGVKCFTRDVPTSEWRYAEISAYVNSHPSPYLVHCDYLVPRGIMVDGRWYPVLKMDWVDGPTLDRFLDDHRDDPLAVEALAARWVEAMHALQARGLAHGDLQHGNILVGSGLTLTLVDYDAMYVPAFRGEVSEESGLRDYQHPRRSGHDFNERTDNFSALVIYISLRALALQPDLWDRYHTDDNLIFQRRDFEQPDRSPLFAALRDLPDARLVDLVDTLELACWDDDPCRLDPLPAVVGSRRPAGPGLPLRRPYTRPDPAAAWAGAMALPVACPSCGVRNRTIARYCRGCGLALPYMTLPSGRGEP